MRRLSLVFIILGLLLAPASAQSEPATIYDQVLEIASGDEPDFTILAQAIALAGEDVIAWLSDSDAELTVFAPTDEAFDALYEALGDEAFTALLEDTEGLVNILRYHVVENTLNLEALTGQVGEPLVTALGQNIALSLNDDGTLVLNDTITIVIEDVIAANGIIHVVDAVLVPPANTEPTIFDLIQESANVTDPEFTILLAAIEAADPVVRETLSDPTGDLTIFVPLDSAFETLFETVGITAEELLADQDLLTQILLYHVTAPATTAADLLALPAFETLLDDETITPSAGEAEGLILNGVVNVIIVDIEAGNGVIHVVDAVLLPSIAGGN